MVVYSISARQYYNTGQAMRMSFKTNMTDYVKGPEELKGRDTVLFLTAPMDPKYYTGEPYFKAFGRAWPLTATPGLEDPAEKEQILEYIKNDPFKR